MTWMLVIMLNGDKISLFFLIDVKVNISFKRAGTGRRAIFKILNKQQQV